MQDFPSVTVMPGPAVAQRSKQASCQLATCLLLALLCACQPAPLPSPGPLPEQLQATRIEQVQRLHIAQGKCDLVLSRNLHNHGITIASQAPADASLRLHLSNQGPLRQHLPLIGTLGWQAHYHAEIIGAHRKILLSLFGQEASLTLREMCDDIGDEIAYKLKDYFPSGK